MGDFVTDRKGVLGFAIRRLYFIPRDILTIEFISNFTGKFSALILSHTTIGRISQCVTISRNFGQNLNKRGWHVHFDRYNILCKTRVSVRARLRFCIFKHSLSLLYNRPPFKCSCEKWPKPHSSENQDTEHPPTTFAKRSLLNINSIWKIKRPLIQVHSLIM